MNRGYCHCNKCKLNNELSRSTIGNHIKKYGPMALDIMEDDNVDEAHCLGPLDADTSYHQYDEDEQQFAFAQQLWTEYNTSPEVFNNKCTEVLRSLVLKISTVFAEHDESERALCKNLLAIKTSLVNFLPTQIIEGIPTTIPQIMNLLQPGSSSQMESVRYTLCSKHHYLFPPRKKGEPRNPDEKCFHCGEPRYQKLKCGRLVEKEFMVYFPILPVLKRLWSCRAVAQAIRNYYQRMSAPSNWYGDLLIL